MKKITCILVFFLKTLISIAQVEHSMSLDSTVESYSSNEIRNIKFNKKNSKSENIELYRHFDTQILYKECRNNFKVILPNQKRYTLQSIDSVGHHHIDIKYDSISNIYTLSPITSGNGVGKIGIFKKSKLIKEFRFKIIGIPPVEIVDFKTNSEVHDYYIKNSISVYDSTKSILHLKAKSTSREFTYFCPYENEYKIKKISITLAKGKRGILTETFSQNVINLQRFFELVKKDTALNASYRLIVEVQDVLKRNYYSDSFFTLVPCIDSIFTIYLYKEE